MSPEGVPEAPDADVGVPPERWSRVIPILEGYLVELERGFPPHAADLLASHPDLAVVLVDYLRKLDVLHCAAVYSGDPWTHPPEPPAP